jgi:hypothetical protein
MPLARSHRNQRGAYVHRIRYSCMSDSKPPASGTGGGSSSRLERLISGSANAFAVTDPERAPLSQVEPETTHDGIDDSAPDHARSQVSARVAHRAPLPPEVWTRRIRQLTHLTAQRLGAK